VERTKAEATRQEYLNKIEAHTAHGKHVLGLDKILEEKKVELDGREWDLELHMAALVEAQVQGFNPQDNDELMEFDMLQRLLWDIGADHVIEASRLATLVLDVS
jgi:hypothetical protein